MELVVPNVWFWVKMAGIVAMQAFISLNEMNAKKARSGDMTAAANSKRFGQLTALAFAVVIAAAVFAFQLRSASPWTSPQRAAVRTLRRLDAGRCGVSWLLGMLPRPAAIRSSRAART